MRAKILLLFLGGLFLSLPLHAQSREEVYESIEQMLSKEDWQSAKSKAEEMRKEEGWSAIPLYQLARAHFLELQHQPLNDDKKRQEQIKTIDNYLVKVFQVLPDKKSVRKDEEYWKGQLAKADMPAEETEEVFSKAMQLCRDFKKGVDIFGREARTMQVTMEDIKRLYQVCERELLEFQSEHEDLKRFYLQTTPAERDTLRAVQQHGEKIKTMVKAYEKLWEGLEGIPNYKKQEFKWKVIWPNARNYERYDPDDFEEEEITVFDFAQWAGTLANKVHQVHHLGEEAELLYTRFQLWKNWTQKDVEEGKKLIEDWKARMQEYGRTEGTVHVLRTELMMGEFMARKARFLQKDQSSYLHKTLRDEMLNSLIKKLDTMRAESATIYPEPRSYAYQTEIMERITKGGQMVAQRDEIFEFAKAQSTELKIMKIKSVHLPPEFTDSLFYQGRVIWLRPGKRDASKLYERGVYIAEAVKEGGRGVAVKGRYKAASGMMPFMMFIDLSGAVKWMDEFKSDGAGTTIPSIGMQVDLKKRSLNYRKKADGQYWLEARGSAGKVLFKYPLENLPLNRLLSSDGESIWLVWKQKKGDTGAPQHKAVQLDWSGQELKSGTFGLNGDICNVINYGAGIHIIMNFKKFIDWEGYAHSSEAKSGFGTNVVVATLDTPDLTRYRLLNSPATIYANSAMFDPANNILRMLGYKGEMEFRELDGQAQGDIQWQEYINP